MSMYPIDKCPRCGCGTAYVKQKASGVLCFRFPLNDDTEDDNSELHENLSYKTITKYAYCLQCNKRLFEYKED